MTLPQPKKGKRLIPATALPLDTLTALDGSFKIKINELRHRQDSLRNIVLEAELQDGNLRVPQFSLAGPMGKSRSSISISPTGQGMADITLDLSAEKLVLNITGQQQDKLAARDLLLILISASAERAPTFRIWRVH